MITAGYNTAYYFDRASVQKFVRESCLEGPVMARAGAYVRAVARSSIRRVKKGSTISRPGTAPNSHDPQGRYKRIEFRWDPTERAMVVGHISYPNKFGKLAPDVNEFGESQPIKVRVNTPQSQIGLSAAGQRRRKKAFKALVARLRAGDQELSPQAMAHFNRRRRQQNVWMTRSARYPKRPVMGPALNVSRARLPELWQNSFDRSRGGVSAILGDMARARF